MSTSRAALRTESATVWMDERSMDEKDEEEEVPMRKETVRVRGVVSLDDVLLL
jgi:hypothetical protein